MINNCKISLSSRILENKSLFLVMKLSFILLVIASMNIYASGYSQSVSLSNDIRNTSIKDVLKTIETQSGYRFFYSDDFNVLDKKVSLKAQNADIKRILEQVFSDTPASVEYMEGNIIIITPFSKQGVAITGTVTDNSGPLPGVNVSVKGTTTGVVTDINGKYSINVSGNDAVLVFSFVGYVTNEFPVGEMREINVVLNEDTHEIEEIVVVGYGTQKKVNLTGAVSSVKVDEQITSRSLTNVSSGLQGLVPGLTVSQASGMAGNNSASLTIRGLGTVNNADPLIVVDDMPDVDINRLNMNDIESISILKDAASSSVYGSRGANGVILIRTKSGKGQNKTTVNFSGNYAWEVPTKAYEFMPDYPRALTLHQQAAAVNTLPGNQTFKNGTIDQWLALSMIDPVKYPNTDWWDLIMRTGSVQNYNLSVSGSNDRSNFFVSLGIMDQDGLQINNDYTRYNARFNFDYKLWEKMNVGVRFNGNWSKYTYALKDGYTDDSSTNTAGFDLQYAVAGIYPYDPITGNYGGVMAYNEDVQAYNPYTVYMNMLNRQNRQEANTSIYWDWEPIKGLVARVDYALNYYNQFRWNANNPNRAYNFQTESYGTRWYVSENAEIRNTTDTGYKTMLNARLNYHKVIAQHHDLSVMFVYGEEYWYNRQQITARNDRIYPTLHEVNSALTQIMNTGGYSDTEGLRSYIGRVNYSAYDKYLLELNFRVDGSSKFLPGHQYGFFPSAAVGWRFTEEDFIRQATEGWLTHGKLRVSYGSLGNNTMRTTNNQREFDLYMQQATLSASHYMMGGNIAKGLVYRKMINEDLSWESTAILNLGLDLSFFKGRLAAEIDYYDRLTTGMLRPSQMSILIEGAYDRPYTNMGDLRNRGIEGNFTWRDKVKDFNYSLNFNISYNKLRLEKWNEFLSRGWVYLDMPYHFVYAYDDRGIAQTWSDVHNATPQTTGTIAPGDILREDINGDGRIDDNDKKAYANTQRDRPTTNYAFNASVSWKGIDLSILFQGAFGRKDFWINNYNNTDFGTQRYASTYDHWDNPWSWDNRGGDWARLGGKSNREETSYWLDNLAYLRMKNIMIGYTLPRKWTEKIWISNFRIYGSAENLFTITNFRGLDPEKTGNRSDAYPINKSFSIGVNVGF